MAEAWAAHLAPRAADAPTVISTFAGGGGSTLGYSMAGYRELLAVEWDDHAVETLRANFPDLPIHHGDIAALGVEEVLARTGLEPGQLDVFDGSPPCQGFSTAGHRKFDDPRNGLYREYLRLLRGLRPRAFVMENVSGMVKGKMKLIFAQILRDMKSSGYRVSARLLDAMYFGVPQSRRRMIFVGVRDDLGVAPSHPRATTPAPYPAKVIERIPEPRLGVSDRVRAMWPRIRQYGDGGDLPEHSGSHFSVKKLDPCRPSRTITAMVSVGGGLLHWSEPRMMSVPELAQLGTFGLDYVFPGEPQEIIARIGNSVPPMFMRAIAAHVAGLLRRPD